MSPRRPRTVHPLMTIVITDGTSGAIKEHQLEWDSRKELIKTSSPCYAADCPIPVPVQKAVSLPSRCLDDLDGNQLVRDNPYLQKSPKFKPAQAVYSMMNKLLNASRDTSPAKKPRTDQVKLLDLPDRKYECHECHSSFHFVQECRKEQGEPSCPNCGNVFGLLIDSAPFSHNDDSSSTHWVFQPSQLEETSKKCQEAIERLGHLCGRVPEDTDFGARGLMMAYYSIHPHAPVTPTAATAAVLLHLNPDVIHTGKISPIKKHPTPFRCIGCDHMWNNARSARLCCPVHLGGTRGAPLMPSA